MISFDSTHVIKGELSYYHKIYAALLLMNPRCFHLPLSLSRGTLKRYFFIWSTFIPPVYSTQSESYNNHGLFSGCNTKVVNFFILK